MLADFRGSLLIHRSSWKYNVLRSWWSVGVMGQIVVAVSVHAVVLLTRLLHRINVHHGRVKIAQLVHQAVVDLSGDGVSLLDREPRVDRYVHLGPQPVPEPPGPHLRDVLHAWNVVSGLSDLVNDVRVYPVQEPGEHHLARLPHDSQDRRSDQEPNDGVRQRVAQPHPDSP